MIKQDKGFTVIELLIVMAMVSILSVMALKGYKEMVLMADEASAQKEMIAIAYALEKYRSGNFTYKGYSVNSVRLPKLASGESSQKPQKYSVTVVDLASGNPLLTTSTAKGNGWAIKAISDNTSNYTLLMNSRGIQCKNKSKASVTFESCGTVAGGAEEW